MIGTSKTMGSRGGKSGDIGSNYGKGMYTNCGLGSRICSTSGTSSCSNEARGDCRNSRRSIGERMGGTSDKLSR